MYVYEVKINIQIQFQLKIYPIQIYFLISNFLMIYKFPNYIYNYL